LRSAVPRFAAGLSPPPPATSNAKVAGVYTSVIAFASRRALDDAIASDPPFLMDKHKKMMAGIDDQASLKLAHDCGFNTLFMTIYPLWGREWYDIPAGRELVRDAIKRSRDSGLHVHLGLSLFNAWFCQDPSKYKGASRTIQCDGTRPDWVCFFDDELWKTFIKNAVEMAKVGKEAGGMQGLFVDPEAYGPELYLCFCKNCITKFNAYAHEQMPTDVVKPDAWLHAHGLWDKYTKDFHDHEVLRHATDLRLAIHAIDPQLQLSSLLWDYPVAVGSGDARQQYFRMLAIGLGTAMSRRGCFRNTRTTPTDRTWRDHQADQRRPRRAEGERQSKNPSWPADPPSVRLVNRRTGESHSRQRCPRLLAL
jgi:hypothetical protein